MNARWLAPPVLLLAVLATQGRASDSAAEDLIDVSANVVYNIRPDTGPTRVSWEVTFVNRDPETVDRPSGTITFYEKLFIPVLKGATAITAHSSSGETLTVSLGEETTSPAVGAAVNFHKRVFYEETYAFSLTYELSSSRHQSLLVTPNYVYLPLLAIGDEARVTVNTPTGTEWTSSVETGDCAESEGVFTCSGKETIYVAALAEVAQPDARAAITFEAPLKDATLPVLLTYFRGEDPAAQHARDLAIAGLPIIEELYGFTYPGPPSLHMTQGGRQDVLGYEGLTSCDADTACSITISPIADDITVLHELAHLWSKIYGKRWLSEGFAQLIAEETALRLPGGLVQSSTATREAPGVDLQLDDWAEVASIIGAGESEVAIETAGYDRSLRFLYVLRHELGVEAFGQVNASIAASGQPTDSARFLDLLEDTSGKAVDGLFLEWVFPPSAGPALELRRQARDRLETVQRRATEEGLSMEIPDKIRAEVTAWRFEEALAALDEAEQGLADYFVLKDELRALSATADATGLELPGAFDEAMKQWEFGSAGRMIDEADEALEAYALAREKLEGSRSVWERFGLLGNDPDSKLQEAAADFADGDFEGALNTAQRAAELVDDASAAAFRRLLILGAVFAVFAAGIGLAVYLSSRQQREFAEL